MISFEIVSEQTEVIIEIINAFIAVIVIVLALWIAKAMKGGTLAKTWNWLAVGMVSFSLLEVYGLLKGVDVLHFGGLSDILEFLSVSSFAIAFYFGRKALR